MACFLKKRIVSGKTCLPGFYSICSALQQLLGKNPKNNLTAQAPNFVFVPGSGCGSGHTLILTAALHKKHFWVAYRQRCLCAGAKTKNLFRTERV
jgi:hypothetical protein